MDAKLKVTQVRSQIGTKPKTKGTLRALGLRRPGDSNILPDRPEIRGMIRRVPHLVTVETVDEARGEPSTAEPTSPSGTSRRGLKDTEAD
jgi:large subunit ribosomal protein L30